MVRPSVLPDRTFVTLPNRVYRTVAFLPLLVLTLLAPAPAFSGASIDERQYSRTGGIRSQGSFNTRALASVSESLRSEQRRVRHGTFCKEQADGKYFDMSADPPCSGFLTCSNGTLLLRSSCPPGQVFSPHRQKCIATNSQQLSRSENGDPGFASTGTGEGSHSLGELLTREGMGGRRELAAESPRAASGFAPSPAPASFPSSVYAQERLALLDFQARMFDPFGALKNWIALYPIDTGGFPGSGLSQAQGELPASPEYCQWTGITCSDEGRVTQIELTGLLLFANKGHKNSIPDTFGSLADLTLLRIRQAQSLQDSGSGGALISKLLNQTVASAILARISASGLQPMLSAGVVGRIPKALAKCRKLTTVDFSNSMLSGSVPDLCAAGSLQELHLPGNFLSGPFPKWVLRCSSLRVLDLSANLFSGPLPATGMTSARNKTHDSTSKPLFAPRSRSLQELYLSRNLFRGPVGPFLREVSNLFSLDLSANRFSGPLPESVQGSLSKLEFLNVSNNKFWGSIPSSWRRLDSMLRLDVSGNMLSGRKSLDMLCGRRSFNYFLNSLDLSRNLFSGTLWPPPLNCFSLQVISLSRNNFSGEVKVSVLRPFMRQLRTLDVSRNAFSGRIPRLLAVSSVADSRFFVTINLGSNFFTGEIPEFCSRKPAILDLSNNLLHAVFPIFLTNCMSLDISNNLIYGSAFFAPLDLNFVNAPLPYRYFNVSRNLLSGTVFLPDSYLCQFYGVLDYSFNLFNQLPDWSLLACNNTYTLDISSNNLSGNLKLNSSVFPNLKLLNASNNQLTSFDFDAENSVVATIDLSANRFEKYPFLNNPPFLRRLYLQNNRIQDRLARVPLLQGTLFLDVLDISNNSLTGNIPVEFALRHFALLNLSFNLLSGPIPSGPGFESLPASSLSGNTGLCSANHDMSVALDFPPCFPHRHPSSFSTLAILLISLAFACASGVLFLILFFTFWKKDEWNGGTLKRFFPTAELLRMEDIAQAAGNFSKGCLIGEGGSGKVYRATLSPSLDLAVKHIQRIDDGGADSFFSEINTRGLFSHTGFVPILATYTRTRHRTKQQGGKRREFFIIYKFMPGGSLRDVISNARHAEEMGTWAFRKSVSKGLASALKYLHHDCVPPMMHRDLKPENVLFDDALNPRVADFGLARNVEGGRTHRSTTILGTVGYLAPECYRYGRYSFKSDVYSYGIMMLQLLTTKSLTHDLFKAYGIIRWCGRHETKVLVDSGLKDYLEWEEEVKGLHWLALSCVATIPAERPSMDMVLDFWAAQCE